MVAPGLRHLLATADQHAVARLGNLVNRRFQTVRQHALEQPVLGRTSPRKAVDEAAGLPCHSHILKAHSKAGYIAASDIVRMYQLKPTKYAAKPVIRDIIKGRYVQTLQPTGAYYVFFDSFDDAAVFWSDARSALFNGSYVSFTFVNFEDEMGQMFFPVLADTRIRKELVNWDALKQSMDHKMHALQKIPHLSNLLTLLKQQPWLDPQQDRGLLEFLQEHPVERCQCVVLHNIPKNTSRRRLLDSFCELNLYQAHELGLRQVYTDRTTGLSTYVAIFETDADARRCVLMADGEHLFYDPELPLVRAELLDERIGS
ncbi:hypothetical protein KL930_004235 [Ogataea haglerorum]|uniref:RRM domain-containing protein n=1 Tax=Ogataea haglerorum TaxID=1937702 RepID=A0AAN6D2M6_9ASCO|nr:hypothetical protein KL933_004038 [Ogataea haglerorum]KAG7738282.1 hypothetical protein KL932_003889 [Ogataea haglerorum]KAG7773722.1 hypothetical protein KL930_004235 [Ogataea haglerorum]KAG7776472.1 hypothetical protein KL922_003548 [Ogataea haglerorum]KAG7798887.1 hypothetical protein KL944_004286 [Ogataea haglerorum]